MSEPATPEEVKGERDSAALSRSVSVQSRISNLLAIGLMSVLGLGMLTWYYARALGRPGRAQQEAQSQSAKRAQGDVPLPSIGRISPPTPLPVVLAEEPVVQAMPLAHIEALPLAPAQPTVSSGAPPPKTLAEITRDRQLSGAVFSLTVDTSAPMSTLPPGTTTDSSPGELGTLLRETATMAVRAQVLPTQRLLLPKGAFLDCTLETAIDSTLPGMTTCVMATDTFGIDGEVVLLERGTKLVGETRGQVQQGAARVFVLWNEARTPSGVIVPLASPGTDELGRSGLPGVVDRHFWDRFGAAMLVSVIDGALQGAVQAARGGNGSVIVNPTGAQDVMTEVLKSTIAIAPTVNKKQGDRIQVLVARDLDFRSVYELKSNAAPQ
jgi:type IV secretion system protein VirB10